RFNWSAATVSAEQRDNTWRANATLEFFQQKFQDTDVAMQGSVSANAQLEAMENLNAEVRLAFDDLNFLEAFVPQLQNTQGQLNSRLQLNGTLEAPTFSGDLSLVEAQTDVPALGIELRNLRADLSSQDGESLTLEASLDSGEGTLNLTSQINNPLDESRRLTASIQGDNFQLADITELVFTISPNLELSASDTGIHMTGTLLIPQ